MAEPGAQELVDVNGVSICMQAFGNLADPAIVLIHGAGSSMVSWDEACCRELAAGRRSAEQRGADAEQAGEPGRDQHDPGVRAIVEPGEDGGAEAMADEQRRDAGERDPSVGERRVLGADQQHREREQR